MVYKAASNSDKAIGSKAALAASALPITICVGWALGTVSMGALNFAKNYLLLFMTAHLGIAALTAGLMITLAKVFDAFTDPFMGVLSDRTRTRWGRRRPYLLVGSFLAGLSYLALFIVPSIASSALLIAYLILVLMFYSIAYTVFGVPHLAMSAEIAETYHQRTYLMSYRAVFAIIGISAGGALVPYLIDYFSGDARMTRAGFEGMAITMSIVVTVTCLMTFALTARAKFVVAPDKQAHSLKQQLKLAWQNRPFFTLLTGKVLFMIASNLVNGTSMFYITYVLKETAAWQGNFFIAMIIATLISQPFWLKLSKRFGKRNVYFAGAAIFIVATLSWLWASADEHIAIFLLRALAFGVSAGGMLLAGNAMLPDTMEYDSRRTGMRREGVFAGLYSTMEKVAAALGVGLLGIVLGSMGFIASDSGIVEQPESAIWAIYLCNSIIPAVLTMMACGAMCFYDLTEKKLEDTQRITAM